MIALLTNRYVLIAIAMVAGMSGLWGYGKYQFHVGYQAAENIRHLADLESFKSESMRLQGLSQNLEAQLSTLREAQPKIIERYNRVVIEKPLPGDCIIDADRLRELNAAITTANTGKSGQPLPGDR
ncbi:hypothetical protein [Zwartia sp.]|uniref:hypothetical protein n=1 Tax=Zwartia sp. TaxID=2978004 RepID=UPI003BAEDBDC